MNQQAIAFETIEARINAEESKASEHDAQADYHRAQAELRREVAKAMKSLLDASPVPYAPVEVETNPTVVKAAPDVRPLRPAKKVGKKGDVQSWPKMITQVLQEHSSGMRRADISDALTAMGRPIARPTLSSILTQNDYFVNEKVGLNDFVWRYVPGGKSSLNQETSEAPKREQDELGFND